jgi:hypothetical protein
LLLCVYYSLNPLEIVAYRRDDADRKTKIYNTTLYKNLKKVLPANTKIVMNTNCFDHVDVMFYNDGLTAYHYCLSDDDIKSNEKQGVPFAVFKERYGYLLSDYVKQDSTMFTIPFTLK